MTAVACHTDVFCIITHYGRFLFNFYLPTGFVLVGLKNLKNNNNRNVTHPSTQRS